MDSDKVDVSIDTLEVRKEEFGPTEPLEGTRRNGKFNLRKSLAWDSAFFTSAGVLEPEELSSMIGGTEKGRKHMLPGIEEDVNRSTDSISTLASDNLTLESLEADLFSDIRASIQKSSKPSNEVNLDGKVASGVRESQTIEFSGKEEIAPRNRLKIKSEPRKPNAVLQGSGKITRPVSFTSRVSRCDAMNGNSTSAHCKPPKVAEKVGPISTTTKRTSLSANRVKVEKDSAESSLGISDNVKNFTSRGVKVPTLSGSRHGLPRPKLPSKSSWCLNKRELTTPSSSFDSSRSLSSENSSKSSLNTVKRKIDSRTGTHSSPGLTNNATLKKTSKAINQLKGSHLSPCLKSVTRLSCSISPASSISEWSSESMSPTSTNKSSNNLGPSFDTSSCKDSSEDGDAPPVLDSQSHSNDKCSERNGHGNKFPGLPHDHVKRVSTGNSAFLRPDSIKPSGLRIPSPKIGFFDGVKSAVRTPKNMQSHSPMPGGLSRSGIRNVNSAGGSNEAKLGKLQPAGSVMAVQSTKIASLQPALDKELKSPLPLQESSNSAHRASSSISRNEKFIPGISLKARNGMTPEMGGQSNLKVEKVAYKQGGVTINNPDFGFPKVDGNLSALKDKPCPESKGIAPEKSSEITSTIEEPNFVCNSSSNPDIENVIPHKVSEDARFDDSNEKEKVCVDHDANVLIEQVGCVDIHREILKETLGNSPCIREANSLGECSKLSSPVRSPKI